MISSQVVSIILLCIWFTCYQVLKRNVLTSIVYFLLLLLMVIPGIFMENLPLMDLSPQEYNSINILLFAFLMIAVLVPWLKFDGCRIPELKLIINNSYFSRIEIVFCITIIMSLYSIIYAFPYAIYAWRLGADTIRQMLQYTVIMPHSILTTIAVGISSFSPVTILFFFISLLDVRLRKYTILLFVSSFAYIVTSMTQAARDGFIFTPLTFVVMFLLFKNSYSTEVLKIIKKMGLVLSILLFSILAVFTISRFGHYTEENKSNLIYGTWGYIYQQPYVFDHVLEQFTTFYGFKRRLLFLSDFIMIDGFDYTRASKIEYMFGTQFADYYEIAGYSSLFIGLFVYVLVFYFVINHHIRNGNYFRTLIAFVIYVYFTLSGLFYLRFGGNNSEFLFYIGILFSSFFLPNLLEIETQEDISNS